MTLVDGFALGFWGTVGYLAAQIVVALAVLAVIGAGLFAYALLANARRANKGQS